jgi:predicted dithiol-disulfide oxidoreductase (DUF899 family)
VAGEHRVVARDEWLDARLQLLGREKEFTRLRDEIGREQRALPWEAVEQEYVFDGPDGRETLADLFDGRSQLIVYHFMFAPEDDAGCPHCSFWADSFDANVVHLNARDVTMVAVSRAPYAKLAAYRDRMGWTFKWLSSEGTDFNYDYGVSFAPDETGDLVYNFETKAPELPDREGMSVFYRDEDGNLFRTYSTYARGIDMLNAAYNYIDLVPKGRDEQGRAPQFWVRRHDEYED